MADEVHEGWLDLRSKDSIGRTITGERIAEKAAARGEESRATPPRMRRIDRWTLEVVQTPSPHADAALTKHTAAIWQMHSDLGLAEPTLP